MQIHFKSSYLLPKKNLTKGNQNIIFVRMTCGIECRRCGGDCRFCNCEYQQESERILKKETDEKCDLLNKFKIMHSRNGNGDYNVHVNLNSLVSFLKRLLQTKL